MKFGLVYSHHAKFVFPLYVYLIFVSTFCLGGHPNDVQQLTGGYFDQGLVGCIGQFATAINPGSQTLPAVNLQADPMGGAGITTCS